MYDAIVVGARAAGSAIGLLLARRGLRVLIIDRATFPSDTMSTHLIHAEGLDLLRSWGLLDRLLATGSPPITTTTLKVEDIEFEMDIPAVGMVSFGLCPRRTVLDHLLLSAAEEAGAEIRTGTSLRELVWDEGRVVGVVCESDGRRSAERARIVIGADGKRSKVAASVEAKSYNERPSVAFWYYNYFEGLQLDPGIFLGGTSAGGANPTHAGAHVVIAGGQARDFEAAKSDVPATFQRILDGSNPELGARVRASKPLERFVGTADVPGFFRDVIGDGWTLVGDAGLHKDPVTGSGITEAWVHASILDAELEGFFSGEASLHDALSAYQRRRDEHSTPWYDWTSAVAAMNPTPPRMLDIFREMQTDRPKANLFARLNAGLMSMQDFFATVTG